MTSKPRGEWTRAADVRAQVKRLWERGELLRHVFENGAAYPLRLRMKVPTSSELADCFEEVRDWIAELRSVAGIRLEMREFNHRVLGTNSVPESLWIDRVDDALALLGKRREAELARAQWQLVAKRQPRLEPWIRRKPLRALELAGEIERLLDVVDWVCAHPRPGIYLRQVDLPGIDTKFIEGYRGVLLEWLELVLDAESIDPSFTGVSQFVERFGFHAKPARIRFRVLDDALDLLPGSRHPDITLDAQSFAALELHPRAVFITENETNFLAFPPVPGSIVVFGAGYGWKNLARAEWLAHQPLYYWGDIDTHGFAILDRLRVHFPAAVSFLMDRATLFEHRSHWTIEPSPVRGDLPRLTPAERAVFEDLRENRFGPAVKLEQERIGFGWVERGVEGVIGGR